MQTALLIGQQPALELDFSYTDKAPYDAVVVGSVTLGRLLKFDDEQVLSALAAGKPVYLYTPGLPQASGNRALQASLMAAQRELKNWGVVFTDGARRHLVTAQEAKQLRLLGKRPGPGAVLTPLAKEILEGSD